MLGNKESFYVEFHNGRTENLHPAVMWPLKDLLTVRNGKLSFDICDDKISLLKDGIIPFYYNKRLVHLAVVSNGNSNGDFEGVFVREDYEFLKQEESVVIDIGANIGDSSIYFVLNGATKVIALEPFKFSFDMAKYNVRGNDMGDRIMLLNEGYGEEKVIKLENGVSSLGTQLVESKDGDEVQLRSLKSLIETYSLEDRDDLMLKMDCEGCEYNLLEEDDQILRHFKKIQIEYHYGPEDLKKKLIAANFTTTSARLEDIPVSDPKMNVGWIYAERIM